MVRIFALALGAFCLSVASAKSTSVQPPIPPVIPVVAQNNNIAVGEPKPHAPVVEKEHDPCCQLDDLKKLISKLEAKNGGGNANANDFTKHVAKYLVKYLHEEFHCDEKKGTTVGQNVVAGQQQQHQQHQQQQHHQQHEHGKETTSTAVPAINKNDAKVVVAGHQQNQQQQQQQQTSSSSAAPVVGQQQKQNALHNVNNIAPAVTSSPTPSTVPSSTAAKSGLGAFFGFRR